MNWITRARVKVDRVACPWLIKKFVDPDAEFFFSGMVRQRHGINARVQGVTLG